MHTDQTARDIARHQLNRNFKEALRRSDEAPNDEQAFTNLTQATEAMQAEIKLMDADDKRFAFLITLGIALLAGVTAFLWFIHHSLN
jgi:hypothetical protein